MTTHEDEIVVSVWERGSGAEWIVVGEMTYEALMFAPRHLDMGVWSLTMPFGDQAAKLKPNRLVTTEFRGELLTWRIERLTTTSDEAGSRQVVASGFDAVSFLAQPTCWPSPAALITDQAEQGNYPTAAGETVIRSLIVDNFVTRQGRALAIAAPDAARGLPVSAQPRFDNLFELVQRKAREAKIGIRLGLVPTTSSTRAQLTLDFYVPQDRTLRVQLASEDGSLGSWSLVEAEPTATRALVGGAGVGAGQYFRDVRTTESQQDENVWGGSWEEYVEGPETFDDPPLDEAGREALTEKGSTRALTMAAREPEGTLAFRDFHVGDLALAIPVPTVEIPDVIQSIEVTHEDGPVEVIPIFGDPDEEDADRLTAQTIRRLRREIAASKTRRRTVVAP